MPIVPEAAGGVSSGRTERRAAPLERATVTIWQKRLSLPAETAPTVPVSASACARFLEERRSPQMRDTKTIINTVKNQMSKPLPAHIRRSFQRCMDCMYFHPEFAYRRCLYAVCPYGKDEKEVFTVFPRMSEEHMERVFDPRISGKGRDA